IDEEALQRIATATGGRAFRARDARELAGIYAEIDRLEPVERPGQALRPPVERYHWPLAAALLLGLLATWRPPRRPRRNADPAGAAPGPTPCPSCSSCARPGSGRCWRCRCWRHGGTGSGGVPASGNAMSIRTCCRTWSNRAGPARGGSGSGCACCPSPWRCSPWPGRAGGRTRRRGARQDGRPLGVALELSEPVLRPGLPPARVLQGRAWLAGLLDAHEGGVALVGFADDAFTVAPLTDDAANVAIFLDALAPDLM